MISNYIPVSIYDDIFENMYIAYRVMCFILCLYISGENILTPLDISIYNFTY